MDRGSAPVTMPPVLHDADIDIHEKCRHATDEYQHMPKVVPKLFSHHLESDWVQSYKFVFSNYYQLGHGVWIFTAIRVGSKVICKHLRAGLYSYNVILLYVVSHESGSKLKNLSDLFKPPFDIIFTGTFEEVNS